MKINWNDLRPEEFEKFCFHILELNEFTNIQWHGKYGMDKGRDLTASRIDRPLPSIEKHSSWVIQCKRYISKAPVKDEIASFLNSAREFKPDNVLLIITNTLSSNVKDWLNSVKQEYQFNIYLWEEEDVITQIVRHKDKLSEFFPENDELRKQVLFYKINPSEIRLGCNEFEEVELWVNCSGYDEAIAKADKFFKFIREHNVIFD